MSYNILKSWCFRRKSTGISARCLCWRGNGQTPQKLNDEQWLWTLHVPLACYLIPNFRSSRYPSPRCMFRQATAPGAGGGCRASPDGFAFVAVFRGDTWVPWRCVGSCPHQRVCPINEQNWFRQCRAGQGNWDYLLQWESRVKTERSVTQSCTLTGSSWLQLGSGASPATAYVRNQKVIKNSHWQVTQLGACLWNCVLWTMQ